MIVLFLFVFCVLDVCLVIVCLLGWLCVLMVLLCRICMVWVLFNVVNSVADLKYLICLVFGLLIWLLVDLCYW